jgi:hypothetical protein
LSHQADQYCKVVQLFAPAKLYSGWFDRFHDRHISFIFQMNYLLISLGVLLLMEYQYFYLNNKLLWWSSRVLYQFSHLFCLTLLKKTNLNNVRDGYEVGAVCMPRDSLKG